MLHKRNGNFANKFSNMQTKEYKGYQFLKDGTVSRNGKLIATGRVYIDGSWHNGIDIANRLFAVKEVSTASPKPIKDKTVAKLAHKLKGSCKSDRTRQLMSKAKQKRIVFGGVEYPSINECAKQLGVSRHTIYRRLADG